MKRLPYSFVFRLSDLIVCDESFGCNHFPTSFRKTRIQGSEVSFERLFQAHRNSCFKSSMVRMLKIRRFTWVFFFKQAKHFQSDLSQGLVWGKRKVGYGISFTIFPLSGTMNGTVVVHEMPRRISKIFHNYRP